MAIKLKVGAPIESAVQEAPKPVPQVKAKLNIRKSIDGNLIIYDYPDVYIVVQPAKRKIVVIPTENIDENLYLIQNKLFQHLIKKGIVDPSTVRAGNIYGAMEATIPQEEEEGKVNGIDLAVLTISRWIDEERPGFEYRHSMEEEYDQWVTNPPDDETTEHGKIPARDSKQYNKVVDNYSNQQKIFEVKKKSILNEGSVSNRLALYVWKGDGEVLFFLYDTEAMKEEITEKLSRAGLTADSWESKKDDTLLILRYKLECKKFGIATMFIDYNNTGERCFGTTNNVGLSAVNKKYQGMKYGRMIYGLMFAYMYPKYVMADRDSVSNKARRMWASFDKNPKIEKVPPNDSKFLGVFDDVDDSKYPKTKSTKDDCTAPEGYKGEEFLMKGYRYTSSKNQALLKNLINNHKEFMKGTFFGDIPAKTVFAEVDWGVLSKDLYEESL
jgi:hypothetical protein